MWFSHWGNLVTLSFQSLQFSQRWPQNNGGEKKTPSKVRWFPVTKLHWFPLPWVAEGYLSWFVSIWFGGIKNVFKNRSTKSHLKFIIRDIPRLVKIYENYWYILKQVSKLWYDFLYVWNYSTTIWKSYSKLVLEYNSRIINYEPSIAMMSQMKTFLDVFAVSTASTIFTGDLNLNILNILKLCFWHVLTILGILIDEAMKPSNSGEKTWKMMSFPAANLHGISQPAMFEADPTNLVHWWTPE